MSLATDQTHLLQQQYRNASNLNARIALHARFSLNAYGWHRWVFDQFALPERCRILDMLYHVPDRNKAFAEVRRVLKPNGAFYAAANGLDHLREITDLQKRFGIPDTVGTHTREFCLENGAEQLAPWFANVSLRRYEDGLRVTETEPLVAFILSQSDAPSKEDTRVEELTTFIEDELARQKAIHITKSTGLFLASPMAAIRRSRE